MSIAIGFNVEMPKNLTSIDFDRKPVMQALRAQARKIAQTSKRLVSARGPSQPNQYPGRDSGAMRRNIKVHASKKKDKFWARVQIDTIEGEKVWYPAVLNYGSDKRHIDRRLNPITAAGELSGAGAQNAITAALWKGLKGWT